MSRTIPAKVYVGDGVYAEVSEIGLTLTTENGIETTNTIVLEPEVWTNLVRWVENLRHRNE
jgi:hypothetical protein